MNVGDRVYLDDPRGRHFGNVTRGSGQDGMCAVKWDSGLTEHIHEKKLRQVEQPEAYETSDPKHPDHHSVMADLWDAREGK